MDHRELVTRWRETLEQCIDWLRSSNDTPPAVTQAPADIIREIVNRTPAAQFDTLLNDPGPSPYDWDSPTAKAVTRLIALHHQAPKPDHQYMT